MSRRVDEEFNVVGLARSPVKRTPRGYPPGPGDGGSGCSGAMTERMSTGSFPSTAGSIRSMGTSAATYNSSSASRHQALQPMSENSLLRNSIYSTSSGTAHTPSTASTLDTMSSEISSKRKALAARRSSLPVSRTLKLSPAADTMIRQHKQESARVADRPAAASAGGISSSSTSSTSSVLYSGAAGDYTHCSMTQSALFSALGHSTPAPHRSESPPSLHQQNEKTIPPPVSSNNRRGFARHSSPCCSQLSIVTSQRDQDQPSTPGAAAPGDTDFLDDGDISDIDGGDHSHAWSDCSFTNAVFSPDPATPAVAQGGGSRNGSRSGVRTRGEREQAASATSDVSQEEEERSSHAAADIAMRNNSNSSNINNGDTTSAACTPAAVSVLLRMGGHPAAAAPTPNDGTAASRYHGYAASSPVPISTVVRQVDVPSTPAAAATLAAMMMGVNGNVGGSGANAVEEQEEEEEKGGSFGEEEAMAGKEDILLPNDKPAMGMQQSTKPTPETPSRFGDVGARLPIVTPRRRKAASQLLDLSKATPRHMIRGILGGNAQQLQQHQRFVPTVTKLMENIEEETPRALLKGVCVRHDAAQVFPTNGGRGSSTAVVEAAAAAAAAAAARACARAAVAGSANGVGESVKPCRADNTGDVLQRLAVEPPRPVVAPSKGAGKGFLKTLLTVLVLLPLLYGAWAVVEDAVVVVCLVFAGPAPTHPIY
ncbi:unnamed protein product [Pylaiella littoralis]